MRYLIIIATHDFASFWKIENANHRLFPPQNDMSILLFNQANISLNEDVFMQAIALVPPASENEIGVIFHQTAGKEEANKYRSFLAEQIGSQLAFCDFYTGSDNSFFYILEPNDDLPYNNLMRAWQRNDGDKNETFSYIWKYFLDREKKNDPLEEKLTDAIFETIYNNKGDEAIRSAFNERDAYLKERDQH